MKKNPLANERSRARMLAKLNEFLATPEGDEHRRRVAAMIACQLSAHAIQTSGSVPAFLKAFA